MRADRYDNTRRSLVWLAAGVILQASVGPTAAHDRLVTLGQIELRPLMDTACADAMASSDQTRLENMRTSLLGQMQDRQIGYEHRKRRAAAADRDADTKARVHAQLVDQVSKLEAAQASAAVMTNDMKASMQNLLTSSRNLLAQETVDLDRAIDAEEDANMDLARAEYALRFSQPAFENAITCVEMRLSALRRGVTQGGTGMPLVSERPAAQPADCQLGPINLEMERQTVRVIAKSGVPCTVNLAANSRLKTGRAAIWGNPRGGPVRVEAPVITYMPRSDFKGNDTLGVFIDVTQGVTTRPHGIELRILVE